MEKGILNYSPTVMFRGTPCSRAQNFSNEGDVPYSPPSLLMMNVEYMYNVNCFKYIFILCFSLFFKIRKVNQ